MTVKGVGGFGAAGSGSKKGKFMTQIFFLDIVEWISKSFRKMIPADVKSNKSKKK